MNVRATVQRMVFPADGMPFVEHRTRDLALFSADEWGWNRDGDLAWVFPMREKPEPGEVMDLAQSAEAHVEMLKDQGEEHVWSCVHSSGHDVLRGRSARTVDPAEAYARMEKEGLA